MPEESREYLVIYTTEYDDSYVLETITADEIQDLREVVKGQSERSRFYNNTQQNRKIRGTAGLLESFF